jgi:hypothetical protein
MQRQPRQSKGGHRSNLGSRRPRPSHLRQTVPEDGGDLEQIKFLLALLDPDHGALSGLRAGNRRLL